MLIFSSAVKPTIFQAVRGEEKNCDITGKTASAVVCGSWHC